MSIKWLGSILIIASCGFCGFSVAANYKREEYLLRQIIKSISYMRSELQFHLTALPDLCEQTGRIVDGTVGRIFNELSVELKTRVSPDVSSCMRSVVNADRCLPASTRNILCDMGKCLGRFDLDGQINGLDMVAKECEFALEKLYNHQDERIRGYRTIGFCAGVSLAILFV